MTMLFGSSGIRRTFDKILIETALRVGSVLADRTADTIIAMDTRTTGPPLAHLVISGIISNGGTARFAGIAPTPSLAFGSRSAGSGCMITASHNPEEYNGLKLFNPDGSSFTRQQQEEIENQLKNVHWADWQHQGRELTADVLSPHKNAILNHISPERNIRVIIDCGNGAGCMLTPSLLNDAGIKAIGINCNPYGRFSRPSEPVEENLLHVKKMMQKTEALCAVTHDGDADRMMAFDNRGRYITGDQLLLLFTRYLGAKRVVTTNDASMVIENFAEVRRTPVGDSFVSEELMQGGDFGGEPSGAWIFPKISFCPDGPYAAALFCEMASEWDIAAEIDGMPSYPVIRESFTCSEAHEIVLALGALNPTDGIRKTSDDGWFMIRASGTEPKIRITAEGKNITKAKALMTHAKTLIRKGKTA